jgi:hypothetical protein
MSDRFGVVVCAVLITFAAAGKAYPQAAQTSHIADSAVAPFDGLDETPKGHGSISISYLDTYVNGFWLTPSIKLPNGVVRSHGIALGLEYYFADAWSAYASIPFMSNTYDGMQPHCPTTAPPQCAGIPALNPQHPESQFIDDGQYHSTWQDLTLGVSYHANVNDYLITPSVTATIPSHDYVFFDNAAVGQRLYQLMLSATLAHQFAFTNLYYQIGYGYAFSQHVLGIDTGYQRFDGELGYFVNERLTLRTYLTGRIGNGLTGLETLPLTDGQTNDYWYHHDQISVHSYFGAGLGFDYHLGGSYTLTAGIQREFWGETVFDFKYAFEARLIKQF